MKTHRNRKFVTQNRNAVIRTREDRTGKTRTETARRDDSTISVAISTNPKTDSTRMFVDFPNRGGAVEFSGSEARTLYRLLQKHYSETGKSC
jgi:hypothetical protein